MKAQVTVGLGLLGLLAAGIAHAEIITHEDPSQELLTDRCLELGPDCLSLPPQAPVGLLSVSSEQTIQGFGVDIALHGDSSLKFMIFDTDSGALLYQSAIKAFVDTGAGYKFSDWFRFTFHPGTIYGLTAISDTGGVYFTDELANVVGAFTFLLFNQNLTGTFDAPVLDMTHGACCDVGTALVTTPEPATMALLGVGLLGLALTRHRQTD